MSIDTMKQALEVLSLELPLGSHLELKSALRAAIEQAHDWDEVEALRASLREHMTEIHRLRAAIEQAQTGSAQSGLAEKVPAKGTLLEQTLGKVWDKMPHAALMDAIIGGTGVMLGDKRIDPASIYKQPEQEPVAWVNPKWLNPKTRHWTNDTILHKPIAGWVPLYTAPRQWQGLTDDEIVLICGECAASHADDIRYARAIESKLKEKNT